MRLLSHLLAATAIGFSGLCLSHVIAHPSAPPEERFESVDDSSEEVVFVSTVLAAADAKTPLPPTLAELPALVREAKTTFKPVAKADVLSQQVAVDAAVRRLDRYLKNSGANGEGWRSYLKLNALQDELKKGLNADPKTLVQLSAAYTNGSVGLEAAPFVGLGKTLRPYADLLAVYQNADAKSQFEKDLDRLADALESAAKQPASVDRRKLGELLAHVAATGEAGNVVEAARKQLAQPNLRVRVSSNIVAGGINDELKERTPVDDVILGTQISGMGDTLGQVRASLIPNHDRAVVEIKLTGTNNSKTVGYNGPVTIFSHSTTSLSSRKRIEFDQSAFTGPPASAQCCTNSCIDCLDICGGPIIRHIATRRVYGSKSTGEAIAAEHAETRLENRMDSRTGVLLANVNRTFNERFRNPLLRRGAFPQQLSFSTTADWLSIVGLQAMPGELGATTPPPTAADDAQLSIRMHESLVENMAGVVAAGKSVRSLAYRRSIRDLLSEKYLPAEFNDFILCLAEAAAPADRRDSLLMVQFDQFQSLMKDRFGLDVTDKDYQTIAKALADATLTQAQFDKYLAGLAKEPAKYDDVMRMLGEAKRGETQVNYSAMTYADQDPISVQFKDGQFRLVMRIQSTTQPRLGSDGKPVVNSFPAEIFVTYRLALRDGNAIATRVENEYGIKSLPLPEAVEQNLSLREKTRRSTLMTKTLPRRFFGVGEAGDRDDEDATAEPIFPAEKQSTGLTLRGRWQRLGHLPWTQLVSQDGWVALGWALPNSPRSAE